MLSNEGYMRIARQVATSGNCPRRQVGCIIVSRDGSIVGEGSNRFKRQGECDCPGRDIVGRSAGDQCHSIHAEICALSQIRFRLEHGDLPHGSLSAYVTSSPCHDCCLALHDAGVVRIVFDVYYPNPGAQEWWEAQGHMWIALSDQVGTYRPEEPTRRIG